VVIKLFSEKPREIKNGALARVQIFLWRPKLSTKLLFNFLSRNLD